jgi:hypothetical protein
MTRGRNNKKNSIKGRVTQELASRKGRKKVHGTLALRRKQNNAVKRPCKETEESRQQMAWRCLSQALNSSGENIKAKTPFPPG